MKPLILGLACGCLLIGAWNAQGPITFSLSLVSALGVAYLHVVNA